MENGHAWLLVAAIFDLTRELAKRLHVGETWCVVLVEGNVDEAHTVLKPEGCIAETVRPRAVQFLVHRTDELLVLGCPLGLTLYRTII
jgi:hypothetical protein